MTCEDFERRLEGWLGDEPLAPEARTACARHLASCSACRELVDLAVLAAEPGDSAEPGPGFVEGVLARTVGAPRLDRRPDRRAVDPPAPSPAGPQPASARSRWTELRWTELWRSLVRRPRFAWEAAYVLTLVLAPVALWSSAPERTGELVARASRAGGAAVVTASQNLTEGAAERAGSLGAAASSELRTFGTHLASSLEKGRATGPDDLNPEKGDAP